MTVASTLNKKQYQGNNLTTEFPLPFHVTAKEHIFALRKKGTKISEIKNNFAVDLERKVFIYPVQGEALASDESLTIYRKIPLTQIVDLENAGAFHPEVLEYDGFDRIVMQIQQLDEEISRALKIDITDTRDVTNLIEELFKAREEAVLSAQHALEQAERAADKAEKTENWALFAEDKVKELTDLDVACFVSNDGQGQVTYDKEKHKLEIVLPFDNAGSNQPKIVLTDSIDLARSDIGASAKAVQSLQAKIKQNMTAALAQKIDKSSISHLINSTSKTTVASSAALNALRLAVPNLAMPSNEFIDFPANTLGGACSSFVAPANGYIAAIYGQSKSGAVFSAYVVIANFFDKDPCGNNEVMIMSKDTLYNVSSDTVAAFLPVKKGDKIRVTIYKGGNIADSTQLCRFYYAQGEI